MEWHCASCVDPRTLEYPLWIRTVARMVFGGGVTAVICLNIILVKTHRLSVSHDALSIFALAIVGTGIAGLLMVAVRYTLNAFVGTPLYAFHDNTGTLHRHGVAPLRESDELQTAWFGAPMEKMFTSGLPIVFHLKRGGIFRSTFVFPGGWPHWRVRQCRGDFVKLIDGSDWSITLPLSDAFTIVTGYPWLARTLLASTYAGLLGCAMRAEIDEIRSSRDRARSPHAAAIRESLERTLALVPPGISDYWPKKPTEKEAACS